MKPRRRSKAQALALPQEDFDAAVVVPPMPDSMVEPQRRGPSMKAKPDVARRMLEHVRDDAIAYWKNRGEAPPAHSAAHLDIDALIHEGYGT